VSVRVTVYLLRAQARSGSRECLEVKDRGDGHENHYSCALGQQMRIPRSFCERGREVAVVRGSVPER